MKPIRWTTHAERKLSIREAERSEVEQTLEEPDHILPDEPPRSIYQRRYYDRIVQQEMLLRVVVEETASELVIVTLYKTSKIEKYTRGCP